MKQTLKIWHVHWDRSIWYNKYCSKALIDKYVLGKNAADGACKYGSANGWINTNPNVGIYYCAVLQRNCPLSLLLNILFMVKGNTWGKFTLLTNCSANVLCCHFYCAPKWVHWEQIEVHLAQPKRIPHLGMCILNCIKVW